MIEGAERKAAVDPRPKSSPVAISIDTVADAALIARQVDDARASQPRCDACDEVIEGDPAGSGLYLWTRGDEVRIEEPPLCAYCATAIGLTALQIWSVEEEEG